jgi:hypothetical protein
MRAARLFSRKFYVQGQGRPQGARRARALYLEARQTLLRVVSKEAMKTETIVLIAAVALVAFYLFFYKGPASTGSGASVSPGGSGCGAGLVAGIGVHAGTASTAANSPATPSSPPLTAPATVKIACTDIYAPVPCSGGGPAVFCAPTARRIR